MSRRPLRIAVIPQLERSAREAGLDVYSLPPLPSLDFHRPWRQRWEDGNILRPFLEKNDIELLLDFNTAALTLQAASSDGKEMQLTNALLEIPYVACYLDPITSTMNQVSWPDHWTVLESPAWIKWVWERAHAEELSKLGIPNVIVMPMAATNDDFDLGPLPTVDDGVVAAFMGHPATSWFTKRQPLTSDGLLPGLTAAAVHADMPDLAFHKIYYDLYGFAAPPSKEDAPEHRAQKSAEYFHHKFVYNAYLALKQRDRFARFLKRKLGDAFELIGDHWSDNYGLPHTPRIWDMAQLHRRMREVPICLNLMKGCLESGLNIRHFEITAHGGFMLTYDTQELADCFRIGEECDTFRSEAELLDKIHHYLHHDEQRRAVAAAGQRRTLGEHLYSHRLLRLVECLRTAGVLPQVHTTEKKDGTVDPVQMVEASATDTRIRQSTKRIAPTPETVDAIRVQS